MDEIAVDRLMSSHVECIGRSATLAEAATLMHDHAHSCLVVTERDVPVGIITERDIVGVLLDTLQGHGSDARVEDCMSAPPLTLRTDASLFEALVLCRSRGIRHLPVVGADGRLAGILTQSDLVRAHVELIESQRELVEKAVARRTSELKQVNARLRALAMEDPLMGIGNRRAMEVDLQYTHDAALRYGTAYSVAMFDVDWFKKYNDTYGHDAGDDVLREISESLSSGIRRSDRLYRYGGEEILLVLPMTLTAEATLVCRRLVRSLYNRGIKHADSDFGVITLSCGVATAKAPWTRDWRGLVRLADKALYQAKAGGKNTLIVHQGVHKAAA
jgi:diguanylate cyclase (GGDEF)-like protein